jgi:tetratricopeptide (TPR) repeat protein
MLLLAFIQAHTLEQSPPKPKSVQSMHRSSVIFVSALVISCLFPFAFFFFVIQPIQGNRATLQAVASQPIQEHLIDFERGLMVSPMGIDRRRTFLSHQTSTFLWSATPKSLEGIEEYALQELALAEHALQLTIAQSPNTLEPEIALGMLYQVKGRLFDKESYQHAESVLQQAIELSPHHQSPKWALASVYLEQGKVEDAVALTRQARQLDLGVYKSHLFYLTALKFLGDELQLLDAIQSAQQVDLTASQRATIDAVVSIKNVEDVRFQLLFNFYL